MPQKPAANIIKFVTGHPRLIMTLALLMSVASIFYTVNKMEFLTGRDDLMPRNAAFQVDYRNYRQEFGDQEEIVVVIESDDAGLTAQCSDAIHKRLGQEQGVFREVFYPGGLPFFRNSGLLFMPLEDIRKLHERLEMAAPILKDLAAAPSIKTLFTSMTAQIDSYLIKPDPHKLKNLTFMLSTMDKGFKGFDGKNSTMNMDAFLTGGEDGEKSMLATAGRQQVITILPVKEADSFVPAEKAILAARAAAAAITADPRFKGVKVGLTGVPVLEYEEMNTGQRDMKIATMLSLGLTVVLLFFAFRGAVNVICAMISLTVAICLSFGFATFSVGHLNILSMIFAVMLIGLGIEYGIQVVLRYQEELGLGNPPQTALDTSLRMNLRSIILAGATTAMAFLTFVLTDFKGISELGLIAAGGIVICVLSTFTVLPAMLVLMEPLRRKKADPGVQANPRLAGLPLVRSLFANPRAVIAVTSALMLLCIYPVLNIRFDFNMMNLQAKGLESVEYAYRLMRSKENSGYFAVVTADNAEEARQLTNRLEKLPGVAHVVSLPALVPDRQQEKLALLDTTRKLMSQIRPVPYEENLNPMELPQVFERFHDSVEKLKNRLETDKAPEAKPIGAFLATLDGFFKSLEKEKDNNALGMLREFQEGMFAALPDKLAMLKQSLTVAPVKAEDVPEELKRRFVGKSGKLLLQVAPAKEIFEHAPLAEFVNQVKGVAPGATGEPVMVYESMTVLRNSYLQAFGYAFIGIALILLVNFRSLRYAVIGALPLMAGLLLMVGGMWLTGIPFNSANIIVLPLLLGVGIDSAIYIINRYRQGSETPAEVAASSAGIGVFLNALTILFSFGALMAAHHQGVFSIGAVMSLGMGASVAVFLAFLPAMLSLWGKR
ncbi:MAG TPA: MMPL family transporter [Deltaproteobacteria bacterium]|nr:MMPL family transporter [Deltaproteobacteria bacterium]